MGKHSGKEPWRKLIPKHIADRYEVHNFRHAAAIIAAEFPEHMKELLDALDKFYFTDREVRMPGGNESTFPKRFSSILRNKKWFEQKLTSKRTYEIDGETVEVDSDTHKVDYCKGAIACDFEWNSKDQTFDRDLFAFSAFHQFGMISAAVLVTRSADLNPYFKSLGNALKKDGTESNKLVINKYGQSTTHLDKLLPRIRAGRGGACPILVFGIKSACRKG